MIPAEYLGNVEELTAWRRRTVLGMIAEAIEAGKPCPTNQEFADVLGYKGHSAPSNLLTKLVFSRRIEIARRGRRRVVTVLATGRRTADPIEAPIRDLVARAAQLWEVQTHQILGPARFKRIIHPRFAIYRVAREAGFLTTEIAEAFARDHSTICYGVEQAGYLAERYPEYASKLADLRTVLIKESAAA